MYENNENWLAHYGVKRRSGRYPWGSGKEPFQHSGDFLSRVEAREKNGERPSDIAKSLGLTTEQYRFSKTVAKHEQRELLRQTAISMREHGYNPSQIARELGYKNESSVRNLFREDTAARKNAARATADLLRKEVEKKGLIDVGEGAELAKELGISRTKLKEAMYILESEEGFYEGNIFVRRAGDTKGSNILVLGKDPDLQDQAKMDPSIIKNIGDDFVSDDNGETFRSFQKPTSISSDRIYIDYANKSSDTTGGEKEDGWMDIRRGVPDLDLGASNYAQARILVNVNGKDSHYLKGMVGYSENIPDGYDIVFHTNKKKGTPVEDVLKKIKDDPENPFGATLTAKGQSMYIDPVTGKKKLSPINKLKEEGEWDTNSSHNVSSQFLSKQPMKLINQQLNLAYAEHEDRFNEIMSVKNKAVRKKMLEEYAESCDSAAQHMKAAAFPRQRTFVISPSKTLKDGECYSPNHRDGEPLALVRYPFAHRSEIAVVYNNRKNKEAEDRIGKNAKDAISINWRTAERMSGADFDGDFVIVIPITSKSNIKSQNQLKELRGFDPKDDYETYPGTDKKGNPCRVNKYGDPVKIMSKGYKQKQMGVVSNLITDMQLAGADDRELARAIKHSMCVIDAEKHKLDYRRSEIENDISSLKKKYQNGGGAQTLISKRKQDIEVPERHREGIDAKTGKKTYQETGRLKYERKPVKVTDPKTGRKTYLLDDKGRKVYERTGKLIPATEKRKLLNETDDLFTLSSGTAQEAAYANYGNKMKALANKARKEMKATGNIKQNPEAKKKYAKEIAELNAAYKYASMNSVKERRAQALARSEINAKIEAAGGVDKEEKKKLEQFSINKARARCGVSGKESRINITERQWEAIEAGALSDTRVTNILSKTDKEVIEKYAIPRTENKLRDSQIARLKAMKNSGYTNQDIADALGISSSTVIKYLD